MFLPFTADAPIVPQPIQIVIEAKQKEEKPKKKLYTLEEKIKKDHYNCEPERYIRADNARCGAIRPEYRVSESRSSQERPISPQTTQKTLKAPVHGSGNTYSYGFCTWHTKNRLNWVPNGLGNAVNWINGLRSTSQPKVGMVAWQGGNIANGYGHVAVVIVVNEDSVTVEEMNYAGWNVISTRTVPKSTFTYLY